MPDREKRSVPFIAEHATPFRASNRTWTIKLAAECNTRKSAADAGRPRGAKREISGKGRTDGEREKERNGRARARRVHLSGNRWALYARELVRLVRVATNHCVHPAACASRMVALNYFAARLRRRCDAALGKKCHKRGPPDWITAGPVWLDLLSSIIVDHFEKINKADFLRGNLPLDFISSRIFLRMDLHKVEKIKKYRDIFTRAL